MWQENSSFDRKVLRERVLKPDLGIVVPRMRREHRVQSQSLQPCRWCSPCTGRCSPSAWGSLASSPTCPPGPWTPSQSQARNGHFPQDSSRSCLGQKQWIQCTETARPSSLVTLVSTFDASTLSLFRVSQLYPWLTTLIPQYLLNISAKSHDSKNYHQNQRITYSSISLSLYINHIKWIDYCFKTHKF